MTSQTDSPATLLTDDRLAVLAEDFLDAMLGSADVSVIGVKHWWDRAKSALETGCAVGDSVRAVTARTARKLQIESLSSNTAQIVQLVETSLMNRADFARWRFLCSRDAVYITAMVRLRRETRRQTVAPKPVANPDRVTADTLTA